MGALTLKSFPFELRGWDIEKFESIDPTDGFGANTRVYISKDQVIQIEPDYDVYTFNTWLTDKGRQFFDGIFGTWSTKTRNNTSKMDSNSWTIILRSITQTLYIFDHCNNQKSKKYFFTIVFEHLSLEVLSLLLIISQNYSFIKLRRSENFKINNDLESNFQLNLAGDKIRLNSSDLCLLVATNPRYEGYYLNLNLRQRFLKGNFKCISLGSVVDLTFPVSFLGSNLNTLKSIVEGNNIICQDLKSAKNPIVIFNSELLKRNDGHASLEMLKMLKHSNLITNAWNGLNMLTPSLNEAGIQSIAKFEVLSSKDLTNFSSLYFLNVDLNSIPNVKRLIESQLLNYSPQVSTIENKLFLDQNFNLNSNFQVSGVFNTKYFHLPSSMFYENEETFVNTEGLLKRTTKLIFRKKTRNNWQILRKFLKQFKTDLTFLDNKDSQILFFNSKKIANFKNFMSFQYTATQSLTTLSSYLNVKTFPFIITSNTYKPKTQRLKGTKLKYWLDDFFSGSKDEYSQNSLILSNCSRILRSESTNFF